MPTHTTRFIQIEENHGYCLHRRYEGEKLLFTCLCYFPFIVVLHSMLNVKYTKKDLCFMEEHER